MTVDLGLQPVPVAQWVKPLLIGHSVCCTDWLRTSPARVENQDGREFFSAIQLAGIL